MIVSSNMSRQKCTSFRTQCYASAANVKTIRNLQKYGQAEFKISLTTFLQHHELDNINGEPVVFAWKIFPGHTTLDLFHEVQKYVEKEVHVQPQKMEDRIKFMSMYNEIDRTKSGKKTRFSKTFIVCCRSCQIISLKDMGHSSNQDVKKSGTLLSLASQMEFGMKLQEK